MSEKPVLPWQATNYHHTPVRSPIPIPQYAFDRGDELFAICANGEWWARMMGMLEVLLNPDTWAGTPDEQEAAVQETERMLASLTTCDGGEMFTDCCDIIVQALNGIRDAIAHQTDVQNLPLRETIAQTVAGLGTTTTVKDLHPASPDTTLTEDSGDVAGDLELRERALCAIISTVVRQIHWNSAKAYIEAGITVGGVASFVPTIGWILALFAVGLSALTIAAQVFVFCTEEVIHNFVCCLSQHLIGVPLDLESIRDAIDECDIGFPYNELVPLFQDWISDPINYGAFIHDIGSTYELLKAGGTVDCECDTDGLICENGDGHSFALEYPPNGGTGGPVPDSLGGACTGFGTILNGGSTWTPGTQRCMNYFSLQRFYGGHASDEAQVARLEVNGAHWYCALINDSPQDHVEFWFDPPQTIGPDNPVRVDLLGGGERMCFTGYRIIVQNLEA